MRAKVSRSDLMRRRGGHDDGKVDFVELFFDLVFVFAVTQLSHSLLAHFTPLGVLETAILFMAVWWVWIYTTWITNWLDPHRTAVRLMLFALMLAGLFLSTSIPRAFGDRGLVFATAFVAMQVGRTLFVLWVVSGRDPGLGRNFQRIAAWLATSGLFWLAGGWAEGEARIVLWIMALAIEYAGPACGFLTPGLGRSTTADWRISGAHMAERCGLFVILSLGESILVSGATFAGQTWTPVSVAAFLVAFLGSVAMWWVYFHIGAERTSRHIQSEAADVGRLARYAYTYMHLPIVAGIVVTAAGDEFLLAHPGGHAGPATAAAILGGPALFIAGNIAFKRASAAHLPLSHIVGLVLLGLLVPFATALSPLTLGAATTVVLAVVAVWERVSLGGVAEQ
jgi:low temperature requirement protein LtrA